MHEVVYFWIYKNKKKTIIEVLSLQNPCTMTAYTEKPGNTSIMSCSAAKSVFALHCFVLPCVPIKMQGVGLLDFTFGYSATLARAHVHNFICSENRGLPSLGDLCREFIAEDHRYYLNVVK